MATGRTAHLLTAAAVLAATTTATLQLPSVAAADETPSGWATVAVPLDVTLPDEFDVDAHAATGPRGEGTARSPTPPPDPVADALARIGWRTLAVPADEVDRLRAATGGAVEESVIYRATWAPDDPRWTDQPGSRLVGAPDLWRVTQGQTDTVIAVLDTGVDPHPDLARRLLSTIGFDGAGAGDVDPDRHGTSAALVAAGRGNNGVHASGYCWRCKILPVRVLDEARVGPASRVAAGIVRAVEAGADVLNLSLAGPRSEMVRDAVAYARDHDVEVVAAAGNEGSNSPRYPAAERGVIAVAAVDVWGRLAPFSNAGSWVDLAAPTCHPGAGDDFCGTSAAAPAVAGTLGALRTVAADSRSRRVQALRTTSTSLEEVEDGLVDVGFAAELLDGGVPLFGVWRAGDPATPAWFAAGTWQLQHHDGTVTRFGYGRAGDLPVVGDWDGDGVDTAGIVRDGVWHLRDRNAAGSADAVFAYGRTHRGDLPLVGDWDGDGADTVGIVRDGEWHLRDRLTDGPGERVFTYGRVTRGDRPVVGDWDGDGRDGVGIVRASGRWHLRDELSAGPGQRVFTFGRTDRGDLPLVGANPVDGGDGVGVVRGQDWFLRDGLSGGAARRTIAY